MRPLEDSLPLKLLMAREAVMERFRPLLKDAGVTEQQWRVLRALDEHRQLDAGELARLVCILMPSLSRILRDLGARGLLEKHRSTADGRLLDVRLTDKGRRFFREASAGSENQYAVIEKSFGADRYAKLLSELDALIHSIPDN